MNESLFNSQRDILISCAPFISPYLKSEIISLGFEIKEEAHTHLIVEGNFRDTIRLNIHLRTANRIYLLIEKFAAPTIDHLYTEIKKIGWEEILPEDGYFSVHSVVEHPEVENTMFLNMKVKDAIADRFQEVIKKRPDSGAEKNRSVIFIFWKDNEAMIYLDTSGEPLTRHGYRKLASKAPLQESLAAALVLSSRWNRESSFINPMCGGGTLAIEAALLAVNKPPGLMRTNYGFMHVKNYDLSVFNDVVKDAEEKIKKNTQVEIIATDRDERALYAARLNAKNAGVEEFIRFIKCDFMTTPVGGNSGVVIFNPPYGERLGAVAKLENTYAEIGDFFKKRCKGYWGYLLTANMDLAKKIGLKAKRKIDFYNGQIKCKFLEFELYEGSRKISKSRNHDPSSVVERNNEEI
ncbi:MAG: methyltransferase [Chitinophagales bacterium]|nr:methyltransferase [Chitinophagales bacterium]